VLIVCTPKYKLRSDGRIGGVGYEGDIMTAEVMTNKNHRKFIPILKEGSWEDSAPTVRVAETARRISSSLERTEDRRSAQGRCAWELGVARSAKA